MFELHEICEKCGPDWHFNAIITGYGTYTFILEYWDNKNKIWRYEYTMTGRMLTAYREIHTGLDSLFLRMHIKIQQDILNEL